MPISRGLPATPGAATDLELARATLIDFFAALADREYVAAADLYGGTYDGYLEGDAATASERAERWRGACESRDAACLPIGQIDESLAVGAGTYRFMVRFVGKDGRAFSRPACCGAAAEGKPVETGFAFTVRRLGGRYRMVDKPISAR